MDNDTQTTADPAVDPAELDAVLDSLSNEDLASLSQTVDEHIAGLDTIDEEQSSEIEAAIEKGMRGLDEAEAEMDAVEADARGQLENQGIEDAKNTIKAA